MFVVTLSKTSLKKLGAGAACCALVVFSAMLGRFISTRTVAVRTVIYTRHCRLCPVRKCRVKPVNCWYVVEAVTRRRLLLMECMY